MFLNSLRKDTAHIRATESNVIHTFRYKDLYLAIDVESGAVHSVDKEAFDVINACIGGNDPYLLDYPQEDITEILGELDELKKQGTYDSPEHIIESTALGDGRHVIKSLCLHVAHDCNLRCKYCFASTGEFHGERMLMSEEVGKKALDFLMEHSGNRHTLEVDFFGGEPLMNFEVVKSLVEYGRSLEKKFNKHINFTMTTNAVALTDEISDYLNREMHNIVISLDGRREIHDALRPTANGRGSFDIIAEKAMKLIKGRGDKEYYVRGTFTNRNLDFTEDVKALHDMGFEQISLEPVVLDDSSPYAILDEHIKTVLDEYERLADYLVESRKNGRWFNFFHFMVDFDAGPCLKKRLSGCGAGVEYAAITPEGDIYPCHQFVGETEFKMGSVVTGEYSFEMSKGFAECSILSKPTCRTCFAKYFCSGGCAANAWKFNGDINKPYARTCELVRKRTELAIGIHTKEKQ